MIKSPLTGVSESIPAKDTAVIGTEHPSKPEQDQDGQNQSESAQAHVRNVSAPSNNTNAQSVKLGQRIRVYWPDDDVWYRGTVEDQKSGITTGDCSSPDCCCIMLVLLWGRRRSLMDLRKTVPLQSCMMTVIQRSSTCVRSSLKYCRESRQHPRHVSGKPHASQSSLLWILDLKIQMWR